MQTCPNQLGTYSGISFAARLHLRPALHQSMFASTYPACLLSCVTVACGCCMWLCQVTDSYAKLQVLFADQSISLGSCWHCIVA